MPKYGVTIVEKERRKSKDNSMIEMRVLLLGEFSGLYKNLYDGLRELGTDVFWASNGDAWKQIGGADARIYPLAQNFFGKIYNYLVYPLLDKRFYGYDVVQMVTPLLFSWQINEIAMKRIANNNDRVFVSAAGIDCFQYKAHLDKKYKYSMFTDNKFLESLFDNKSIKSRLINKSFVSSYKEADGIIPCVPYEYEIPYAGMSNLRKCIMFPINYNKIDYNPNVVENGKIVFFHGISRPTDKGSKYIIDAMEIIREKYKDLVECIIVEKVPFVEYTKLLSKANVIIDQCKSYGYGINACISMAMGKVVMSGAEPEVLKAGNINDCPVINIRPDVNHIVERMERLINDKQKIEEIGWNGREYICNHHDYINIAKQYLEEWGK